MLAQLWPLARFHCCLGKPEAAAISAASTRIGSLFLPLCVVFLILLCLLLSPLPLLCATEGCVGV